MLSRRLKRARDEMNKFINRITISNKGGKELIVIEFKDYWFPIAVMFIYVVLGVMYFE